MSDHIDSITHVVGLLRGSGKLLVDEEVVAVLLVSLPESFSGLITALEGCDEKDLTVEYVTGKILDEHQWRMEASSSRESNKGNPKTALKSSGTSRGVSSQQKLRLNYNSGAKDGNYRKERRVFSLPKTRAFEKGLSLP